MPGVLFRYSMRSRRPPPSMDGQRKSVRSLGGEGLKVMLSWRAHFAVSPQAATDERLFFVGRDTAGQRPIGKAFLMSSRGQGLAAAPPRKGVQVMVEGKTLFVFLLRGRCQHSATVPQPAKKGAVSGKRAVRTGEDAQAREVM